MTLHLIRHASAGDRSRWSGDDLDRPLDDRGLEQAAAVAHHLGDAPVREVWSSLAVRCVQTVAPAAATHGLEVVTRRELTEGARAAELLALLHDQADADGDLVLCSHGDLIPDVLNRLLREGMTVKGPRGCEKGSIWALETTGREITSAAYTPIR